MNKNQKPAAKSGIARRMEAYKEMSHKDRTRFVGNWLLDHAMILIIVILVIYIQTQRPAFLKTASIINIFTLTAARLPMALGIAGTIILTGTDLSAGRVVGLSAFTSRDTAAKIRGNGKVF